MKKILAIAILVLFTGISVHADFMDEEIDPICSISGTTHTHSAQEISDTSNWYIPKAYDGACEQTPTLSSSQKAMIADKMIALFEDRGFIDEKNGNGYTLTSQGEELSQDRFFPAVAKYIQNQRARSQPNTRSIAILNYAVSIIGYDYYISLPTPSSDYIGLSVEDARELAISNDVSFRVVEIDGEPQAVTMDYRPGRINASTKNDIVASYSVEGGADQ